MGDLFEVPVGGRLADLFPGLKALTVTLEDVRIEARREDLESFKARLLSEVTRRYDLLGLKDVGPLRAYRDFYWKVGIDPTKVRPSAEALLRRTLGGKPIPTVNTVVDAYNLASVETLIALAAFDLDQLDGEVMLRWGVAGEAFQGIGMGRPVALGGHEVVGVDHSRIVALYPYRDADHSKVTLGTHRILLMACGVPGIPRDLLETTARRARELILRFCT